jgi:hypothetical protein
MPKWFGKRRQEQEQADQKVSEVALAMRELMAREPRYERRTVKPYPQYPPQHWDHWKFSDPDNDGLFFAPEEMVGTVFPDDFVIVNSEWRKVLEVSTDADPDGREPIIFVEKTGLPI